MAAHGLMVGDGAGFKPEKVSTRAEVVQVLYNMAGKPAVPAGSKFTDVPSKEWYAKAVNWAAANGIAAGHGNGKFAPNDPVTREQFAKFLHNYAVWAGEIDMKENGDLSKFPDAGRTSDWAEPAIKWAVGHGLISGTGTGLVPLGKANRAQMASILMRLDKMK